MAESFVELLRGISRSPKAPIPRLLSHFGQLADPEVTVGTGLYVANLSCARPTKTISSTTYGIDPTLSAFLSPAMASKTGTLQLQNAGILDMFSRGQSREQAAAIQPQISTSFEVSGTTLTHYDQFQGGGGFGGDGFIMVSDQTVITLFPARSSATPNPILLQIAPGADPDIVADRLRELIPSCQRIPPLS